MERQYTSFSRDAQEAFQASGGTLHYHPDAYEITKDFQKERIGIWTASFPKGTTTSECLMWTPRRTVYLLYSLPGERMFVEPKEPTSPYRGLYLLTPEMQEKYGLSFPLDIGGYPEISERSGVKEVVVPGQQREGGRAIFLDGFGTGQPGFDLVFVLFTYHQSGQREIYLIPPSEKDDLSKRYAHLYAHMPEKAEHGVRTVMTALDSHLKETYGIDWEQEIAYGR